MQRLFNVNKWALLSSGTMAKYASVRSRKVVLEVNSPDLTRLYIREDEGSAFLGLVQGRDTLEFWVSGAFAVYADGDVSVYTVDGDGVTFEDIGDSFAIPHVKRTRNPELELIAARMSENMNRRLEQQADELAKLFERRMATQRAQPTAADVARQSAQPSVGGDDRGTDGGSPPARKRGRGANDRGGNPDPDQE